MSQDGKTDRRQFLSNTTKAAAAIAILSSPLAERLVLAQAGAPNLASDPRRPQFHLLPAANWMNDPNGPIYWKGRYHMFFQYNPNAAVWGDMHWAHAFSPDMVHWKQLPVALAPTPGGPDADGCFSGTAVVREGVVTFIYTGVATVPPDRVEAEATLRDGHNNFKETQCYATSTDPELRTWTKRPTPVIPTPPSGMKVTGFRDPAPWREPALYPDGWLMAVGSGTKESGGAVLLYKSADLQNWEYVHVVAGGAKTGASVANPVDSGDMWECPDLFPLGNKHVLIYSTQGKVFWKVGELSASDLLFHEEQSGVLDYGSFYAPKTQLDKSGNRILWGWIPETRPVAEYSASGWAGLMSLPRVLTMGADGRLRIGVLPAVEKLRQHEQKLHLAPATPGAKEMHADQHLKNACGELLCVVKPVDEPFTLDLVNAAEPQSSFLSVRYSHANPKELVVGQQRLPIQLGPGEPLELRMYVDGSVIELFANNQVACTTRFDYSGQVAPEIAISTTGKPSDISRLSLWQLKPISPDRLTT